MAEKQYTRQAQEALNMARKIAAELKHPYVGTEHLPVSYTHLTLPTTPSV